MRVVYIIDSGSSTELEGRRPIAKMAPEAEQKRRKIEPPRKGNFSSPGPKKTSNATSVTTSSTVAAPQASGVDLRIQQAKNFAVAQAQQEGCTGNFRVFDSPFGNFLVPVVPSRAELAG